MFRHLKSFQGFTDCKEQKDIAHSTTCLTDRARTMKET